MTAILERLGFEVRHDGPRATIGERFVVHPPWWRTDVSIPDDIAEEVVRIAGYERLPATTIRGRVPPHERAPLPALRDEVRDALVDAGLQEVISYSLTTPAALERVRPFGEADSPLRLQNTLSSDHELLRTSLRHSLLDVVDRNLRAGARRSRFSRPRASTCRGAVRTARNPTSERSSPARSVASSSIAGVAAVSAGSTSSMRGAPSMSSLRGSGSSSRSSPPTITACCRDARPPSSSPASASV